MDICALRGISISRIRTLARLVFAGSILLGVTSVGAFADGMTGHVIFTEDFSSGTNEGQWMWGGFPPLIAESGGNPGRFLRSQSIDAPAPLAETKFGIESEFTGDYRAKGVQALGVDMETIFVGITAAERPLTLMLTSDNNTPDPFDDCTVFFVSDRDVPLPGNGWRGFNFLVPADSTHLPSGWSVIHGCPLDLDGAWNLVMNDVDQVEFYFGDPRFFFFFQIWEVGMDNPTIITALPPVNDTEN